MNCEAVDILLAEDSPADAELILRELRKLNVANRVSWVKDGAEALDFVFGEGAYGDQGACRLPKLLLLDIKMPKLSGLEVLERIKADPRTRTIPVVMLTSSAEDPDIQRSYRLGANSYIVKPVGFDGFVQVVSKLGFYWMMINKPPV